MKNRRYSNNDRHFWPFTLSKTNYNSFGIVLDSGANDDHPGDCHIRFYAFKYTLICELPQIISDHHIRHIPTSWNAETINRLGRNWYDEVFSCEYGFNFIDSALHVYYGAQTFSSDTTQNKVYFLPWLHWTHIRRSLFDTKGEHFWTEYDIKGHRASWIAVSAVEEACPKIQFEIDDYDGERIIATTHIEEREWHFGTGAFRWLSWFRKPMIQRTLQISFASEVGTEKGSWKGGTIGTSIEMKPGELHESAFRRFCEQDHRAKYNTYRIQYVGRIPDREKPINDCKEGEGCAENPGI